MRNAKTSLFFFFVFALFAASLVGQQRAWSEEPATLSAPPIGPIPQAGFIQDHATLESKSLMGRPVQNEQHKTVGKLENLILDRNGRVNYAVLAIGGIFGFGETLIKIPYSRFQVTANAIVLSMSEEELKAAEPYERAKS